MYKKGLLVELREGKRWDAVKQKGREVVAKVKKGVSNFKFNRNKPKVEASVRSKKGTMTGQLNTYRRNNETDNTAKSLETQVQGEKWEKKNKSSINRDYSTNTGQAQRDVNTATNTAISDRNKAAENYMKTDPRRVSGGLRRGRK
tara:strand:+ start:3656 stop:4090 length:435 start_codon:yes stop_codon:yes gene_type:complete